jgi:glycosyltransferase involved in cell wall biosynthesis
MRVLKVTQTYYPFLDKGGPAVKVRAIAKSLANRGHRVTVLTADLGLRATQTGSSNAERSPWGWRVEQDGVEIIYLRGRGGYRTLTWNPGALRFCRQQLRSFDLVHIYGLYDLIGPVVAHFCRRAKVPYVVEPMGMFRPIVRNLRLKQLYHRLLGQRMLDGARLLIATAEQERRELVGGGVPSEKVVVRRNGVEIPDLLPAAGTFRRQWNIPVDAKVVLFLGRLVSKKNPDLLLEAFAGWKKDAGASQAAVLAFVGPDEGDGYRQKLEALSARLGLSGRVLFTGPLYDQAKWAAYRDAHVFVLPSQNENFGNTVAEAVACGTPVIVSDRCGIAPLVDGRAGLVVPCCRSELQAGLARMLQDESLRERLRAGCLTVSRSLSWDEPLALLEALYGEVAVEVRSSYTRLL